MVEEKLREDRLRALGLRVVRWTWDDLRGPAHPRELLMAAGLLPGRTRRWPARTVPVEVDPPHPNRADALRNDGRTG